MHYYEVAPTVIIRSGSDTFTYSSDVALAIGTIVNIEVGKKTVIGLIIRETSKPEYATKIIKDSIELQALPKALIETAVWTAQYYKTPLAHVLRTILPSGIQKNRRESTEEKRTKLPQRTQIVFTEYQQKAIDTIAQTDAGSSLLHGVTGSGKTAVYIELAKRTTSDNKSVIVLVPEIALTSQLVKEFSNHFEDIILLHSMQTESERHKLWKRVLSSPSTPRVIIGPRSALFAPLDNLGLIVVDECHEPSYQQEQAPRYSALRVASTLARLHRARCVFGSATPNISDMYLAKQSNQPIISMPTPARERTVKPTVQLIDMTKRPNFKAHRFISDALIAQIEKNIAAKKQTLIFHNRRGSASTTLCERCGWQAGCPRCYVVLTLHSDAHELRCHICGYKDKVPTSCPQCSAVDIVHKGIGTKLIESELNKLFASASIMRFDGDSHTSETLEKQYQGIHDGDIDIIIGTQVVAKGLDLPHLRTVGVIQADAGLSLPDYSASERAFQLLAQVVGRVGRSEHATHVVVQSYQPLHPAVVDGIAQNYESFYSRTLALRKHTVFPPFCFLLKLTCVYKTEATAIKNTKKLASILSKKIPSSVEILGPSPAFYERSRDTFRWQLIIKSHRRQDLLDVLQHLPPTHWQYELDPLSLL